MDSIYPNCLEDKIIIRINYSNNRSPLNSALCYRFFIHIAIDIIGFIFEYIDAVFTAL